MKVSFVSDGMMGCEIAALKFDIDDLLLASGQFKCDCSASVPVRGQSLIMRARMTIPQLDRSLKSVGH